MSKYNHPRLAVNSVQTVSIMNATASNTNAICSMIDSFLPVAVILGAAQTVTGTYSSDKELRLSKAGYLRQILVG